MAHRIPKSAQKKIDAANRDSQRRHAAKIGELTKVPAPWRMDGSTPRAIANLYDVFFNGEKQMLCLEADVRQGMIKRWSAGRGNRPVKGATVQQLFGRVEIKVRTR